MQSTNSRSNTKINPETLPIPITMNKNQYSLKQNFFDPTKSSPPNHFMIKLYSRILEYESNSFQKQTLQK
jgi:hypothetical protein